MEYNPLQRVHSQVSPFPSLRTLRNEAIPQATLSENPWVHSTLGFPHMAFVVGDFPGGNPITIFFDNHRVLRAMKRYMKNYGMGTYEKVYECYSWDPITLLLTSRDFRTL